MQNVIGAEHLFHDEQYAADWANRFIPTPERMKLFNIILCELQSRVQANACVVELGIGPGYMAGHILKMMPDIQYYGIDFSDPMLSIAKGRLNQYLPRVTFIQADLVQDPWWTLITAPVDAIISTWSLHDVGSKHKVASVYQHCAQSLQDGGILLNGDFIKPDQALQQYEPGRFSITEHIEILLRAGFKTAECIAVLEEELEAPTSAQNYACLKAVI